MSTYYQGSSEHPQHVSVGAIVMNGVGQVCCHHIKKGELKGYWVNEDEANVDDVYLLMRETLGSNETLEDALHRGLHDEFGIEAKLVDYVGSIQSHFEHKGVQVEKTTLYFFCMPVNQDESKRNPEKFDGTTNIEWQEPEFLIEKMKAQAEKYSRTDIDESSILERFLTRFPH